jgi:hypothetical protein
MPAPAHINEGPPDPVLVVAELVAVPPPAPPAPVVVDVEPPPEPLVVPPPHPRSVEARETAIARPSALRMIDEDTRDPRKFGANLGHFDLG